MKKSEFETLIDRAFGVLNARYGLKRVETNFRARGVTVRFANATTLAILDYRIGEEPWLTISDIHDEKNKSTLGWLLVEKGIEKPPTPEQAFHDKLLTESNLAPFIQKMCDQLLEYAPDQLRGDFTIMSQLQARAKKYALECKRFAAIHNKDKK